MNDFYTQLERQLVEAGRTRAGRGRWRLLTAGRGRPLLAMATALVAVVVGVAVAPALRSGSSSEGGGGSASPPAPSTVAGPPGVQPDGPVLRGIRVAVLNATTISGLARDVADALEAYEASIDFVGTAPQQDLTQSVVEFRAGAERQARLVGFVLGVSRTRALPATEFAGAPTATVIVRVGSDRRRR